MYCFSAYKQHPPNTFCIGTNEWANMEVFNSCSKYKSLTFNRLNIIPKCKFR